MNHTRTTAVVLAAAGLLLAGCSSNDPAPDKTVGAASPGTGTATLEASLPPDGPKKPAPAGNRAFGPSPGVHGQITAGSSPCRSRR
ncbi:hypothetical protein [Streptomyces sp. SID1034]|uniref:hypothetical protein n=1 Tax=Streptomyces TaxID=1883 RepID=UPI00136A188A|nr:hypothetical protein [Streptomyces sp. SID1034]MYV94338.1 hypothetical protein [Streptomyces sp. SID1034]